MKRFNFPKGTLNPTQMEKLIDAGQIHVPDKKQIAPSSLDLTTSDEIYRISSVFLPMRGIPIDEVRKAGILNAVKHDINTPLERGVTYLIRLNETLNLQDDIFAVASPKSSIGRLDLHVRILSDGHPRYDSAPKGYRGGLWVIVVPKSFPTIIGENTSIIQFRFVSKAINSVDTDEKLMTLLDSRDILYSRTGKNLLTSEHIHINDKNDGNLIFTIDLTQDVAGWKAKHSTPVLDMRKGKSSHNVEDFFEPIHSAKSILCQKDSFYLLTTRQRLKLGADLSTEFLPVDHLSGEFRTHYAGFVDPGWGTEGRSVGRQITLELRPFEDIILTDNQAIVKMRFEFLSKPVELTYDELPTSNYKDQHGPRLGKYFKT